MPHHSWQLMHIVHIIFYSGSSLMLDMTQQQMHFTLLYHVCLAGEYLYDAMMVTFHVCGYAPVHP